MNWIQQRNNTVKKIIPLVLLFGVCLLFFYKTIFGGQVPFPGDLLLAQYAPWRHVSYDGFVAGSVPSKDQYFDVLRELYPWRTQVIDAVKHKTFPLWNPYNGSGAPLLANFQSQVFYPFSFVYYIFPQITAWTIMTILQPVLGTLFMYLFATEIGLTSVAGMLVAILFNFSSFANVWIEFTTIWHVILWIPFLLFLIERGIKQKTLSLGQQALFIGGLFSAMTGGHPQDFINSFLFICIYTLARVYTQKEWDWKEKRSFIIHPILFIFTIPFFLGAIQLFPTIELYRNSARVTHDYAVVVQNMLIQWWQLPLLAVQEFFGNPATRSSVTGDYVGKTLSIGVVGFFLIVTTLFAKTKSWYITFFSWTSIAILLLTVRTPFSELFYTYPLPILSTGTPTRILFLLMFSFSLLAGFGFDALWKAKKIPNKALITTWSIWAILWMVVVFHPTLGGIVLTPQHIITIKRAMMFATAILLFASIPTLVPSRRIVLLLLLPLAVAELFYGFIKFNPFVPQSFVFPENPLINYLKTNTEYNRFWGYGTTGMEANFATQAKIYSVDGTDPLNIKWYNQLIQASRDGNMAVVFNRASRSDAQLAPGYGAQDLPSNTYRLRLMDILGVKYVIDRSENPKDEKTFSPSRFKEAWHKDDWTVYENVKASPRFFLTSDVRPYIDNTDLEQQLFSDTFIPGKTVLVSEADFHTLPAFTKIDRENVLKIISYEPNKIEMTTTTDMPQLLYISDTYDHGWMATINGVQSRVLKANFAFRSVVVPKGESTIVLTYRPKSFETGLTISIIALLLTMSYFAWHLFSPRPKQ